MQYPNINSILSNSDYSLSIFSEEEMNRLEANITDKTTNGKISYYTNCLVRNKSIKLTPEEVVRQLYLDKLINHYNYPTKRIRLEYGINFGRELKRADIVIMDKDQTDAVYIIVETKKPKAKDGKEQLKSYCHGTGATIAVWTNGSSINRYHRKNPNYFEPILELPNNQQTLVDILQTPFTLADLIAFQNDPANETGKSLKDLVMDMEDEVLANAGVDVFEELFKLLFAKLYDEVQSANQEKTRNLEFRNAGETETVLKDKIQILFDKANKKWDGVFTPNAKILLTASHLGVCVASLEKVKLFNSNLDVVDEAFEYLINKSSKGEKGQYFTPRYVIDMCVKMLNPTQTDYMIDTAAGSSGFTVHGIFHVWKQMYQQKQLPIDHLFTIQQKPQDCVDYVREKVFAIDFDERAVRVARTLNLIAGDGQTNVLHLNTLDFTRWEQYTKNEEWRDTYNDGFKKLKKLATKQNDYKHFEFDVLMANPPFAGEIKEGQMLAPYELAEKNGKVQTSVGRDILFIERNLNFLKPGGRMAIVLPQGRFNNQSDQYIRQYIAQHCRILAVVGLHGNTFKPHTGTKTSVLIVQKWLNPSPNNKQDTFSPKEKQDTPSPSERAGERLDNYPIFFATQQLPAKDNSGDKLYWQNTPNSHLLGKTTTNTKQALKDQHQHPIIAHDLFNTDGLTQDGIAEAFIEFAKKEQLSFF
jgi:type I restriction enzyme M protein